MNFRTLKILLSFAFVLILNNTFFSQTVLIKDKVPHDFSIIDEGIGPNRKHYSYSYFGIGKIITVPITDSVLSVKWNALKVSSGYTGKYQANKYLGLLFDFDFSFESYALNKIDSSNTINYNPSINKVRYVFYKVSSDLALQFNLRPKRGNQLGTYITLGGYVDYNISRRLVTKAQFENVYEVNQKNVYKKPSFTTPFQYGVVAKFGKHSWDIFAKYRISNAFDNGQTEIPRLIVGLEFLIHERDQ
jgi:hypothetical protein